MTLSNVMRVMKLEPCNFGLTTKPYDEGVAASNKNIPQLVNPPLRNPAYAPVVTGKNEVCTEYFVDLT